MSARPCMWVVNVVLQVMHTRFGHKQVQTSMWNMKLQPSKSALIVDMMPSTLLVPCWMPVPPLVVLQRHHYNYLSAVHAHSWIQPMPGSIFRQ